jgi:hypothetical protein
VVFKISYSALLGLSFIPLTPCFSDEGGKTVDSPGARIPFQAVPGVDQVFTFTVSGVAASSTGGL